MLSAEAEHCPRWRVHITSNHLFKSHCKEVYFAAISDLPTTWTERARGSFGLGASKCADGEMCAGLRARVASFEWALTSKEMAAIDAINEPDGNPTLFSSTVDVQAPAHCGRIKTHTKVDVCCLVCSRVINLITRRTGLDTHFHHQYLAFLSACNLSGVTRGRLILRNVSGITLRWEGWMLPVTVVIASLAMPFRMKERCPLMTCVLRLAMHRPGIVVDIGANGGCETRLALSHGRRVVAFECLASAYWELLQEPLFRTHQNLTLLHVCAGSSVNVSSLHLASDSSSLMSENVAHGPEENKAKEARKAANAATESVVVVPADQLLPPGEAVALVKIDVQGAEWAVLKGLQVTIRRHLPVVTFEYLLNHPSYNNSNRWSTQGNPAHDILQPLGYKCFIDFVDYVCLPPSHKFAANHVVHQLQTAAAASPTTPTAADLRQAPREARFPCGKDRHGLYT